jgi:hypothetical protein
VNVGGEDLLGQAPELAGAQLDFPAVVVDEADPPPVIRAVPVDHDLGCRVVLDVIRHRFPDP